MNQKKTSILIIYTGGTIGMLKDPKTGSLVPMDFDRVMKQVPELNGFDLSIHTHTFENIIDSSNINPEIWVQLAKLIEKNYDTYDGFVILHGTDTMAYSASALSYLLEGVAKPVVFTGAQLPIGTLRTDGKENFISAVEIAAAQKDGEPIVPEVCVFFENMLYRGNRTTKHSAAYFDAFRSHNYPALAKAGINITYNFGAIGFANKKRAGLKTYDNFDSNVAVLRIIPGLSESVVDAIIGISGLRGLIIESYGSGNAPTSDWFVEKIKQAVDRGIIVLNVTQCSVGSVNMGKYETSLGLKEAGVLSGKDITSEAAVTKMMFLLGQNYTQQEVVEQLSKAIRGEINE